MSPPRITAVLLASGRSERFGSANKLLAPLAGMPVVLHTLDAARSVAAGVVVVADDPDVSRIVLAGAPDVRVARPDGGSMGRSIAAGVGAADSADGWLIWPADMPLVRAETVRRIIEAFDPLHPVVPLRDGRQGHPVLFPQVFGDALRALQDDVGARRVLAGAQRIVRVEVDDPGIHADIDTAADLAAAEAALR